MPKITISRKQLESLIGKKVDNETLTELMLMYLKADLQDIKDDELTIKMEDTNRPDLWSAEGIARCLRNLIGTESGFNEYNVEKSDFVVNVDDLQLKEIRPFIACALVKNVKLTDELIKAFMQMQDKLDANFGRKRKKTSIGFYDLDKIKSPVLYTTVDPSAIKFVPLGFSEEMNPKQILEKHPKGIEYGHLIKDFKQYPILIDSDDHVLSLPPVINSNDLGNVNGNTKNLLIEVTGTDNAAVSIVLGLVVSALAEHGGKIYSTTIKYKHSKKSETCPKLEPFEFEIKRSFVETKLGIKLSMREISKILEKMGYGIARVDEKRDSIKLNVPFYRKDIMHSVDVVEDVAIGYGLNNFEATALKVPTNGELDASTKKIDMLREVMVGIGHQEVLSFMLTSKQILFDSMNIKPGEVVEIANPISANWEVLRNRVLPVIINFLATNKTVEFPQKVFELGAVVEPDNHQENKVRQSNLLCAAISHPNVTFTEIKSVLDKLFHDINRECSLKATENPSFIPGRCAEVIFNKKSIGIIGEIHPQVLENFGMENPAAVFEIEVEEL
jgi:phenylalanyl-tRNA synthetase beta chain